MKNMRIRRCREALGLTRGQLAGAARIDVTTLWRIEEQGRTPRLLTLLAIERALSRAEKQRARKRV